MAQRGHVGVPALNLLILLVMVTLALEEVPTTTASAKAFTVEHLESTAASFVTAASLCCSNYHCCTGSQRNGGNERCVTCPPPSEP